VLTEDGDIIDGFERRSSRIFSGDSLDHTISWEGDKRIGQLSQQNIRLKFYMNNATLYSFKIEG
jgi:hypothetical protein